MQSGYTVIRKFSDDIYNSFNRVINIFHFNYLDFLLNLMHKIINYDFFTNELQTPYLQFLG